MAAAQEKLSAIARIWAESLLALAAEGGAEDALRDELEQLVAVLDQEPRLDQLLASPLVDDEAKRQLLERVLRGRATDLLVDALQVMRKKGRLDAVRAVERAYQGAWMRRRNRVEVRVTTPVPLGDELRQELRLAAAERTNRHPVLVERVDPRLLGGMVVTIDDEKIDSSVARALARLEESLMARASGELLSGKSYFTESV